MVEELYYHGRLLHGGEGEITLNNKVFLIFQPEQVG
jgi:hypothetical protein